MGPNAVVPNERKREEEEKEKKVVNEVITYLGQGAVAHHEEHAVVCVAGDVEHGAGDFRSSLGSSRVAAGRAHLCPVLPLVVSLLS